MFLGVAYSMMTYSKVVYSSCCVGTDLTAHEYLFFKLFVLGILYFGISYYEVGHRTFMYTVVIVRATVIAG